MRRLIIGSILAVFMFTGMATRASADWASKFVVYDGGIYRVTDTEISADKIGKKVGKVSRYSDQEGTYRGNFSNTFAKGTPYYAIQGESIQELIAVKGPDGEYMAAVYSGEYASASLSKSPVFWIGLVFVVLSVMFAAVWLANPK
jgi:hypothetical protein